MRLIRSLAFVSGVALIIGAGTTPAAALGPAPSAAALLLRAAAITRPAAELFGSDPRFGLIGDGVNTGTGNLVLTGTDLVTGWLSWSRIYNSLSDRTGPQGTGWTTTYSASLAVQAGGNVVLTDNDGRTYTYVTAGGGFTRPLDLDDQLRSVAGGFVLDRGSENWTFTSGGRLTAIERDGERLTLSYDGIGRLTGVVSSAGQRLTIGYTGDRISSVTTGDGRVVRYEYTGTALATVIGADTTRTTYTSGGGRITSVTDPSGTTAQTYDGGGRVVSQTLGAQTPLVLAYDDAALQGALRDPGTLQILVRAAPGRALPIARAVHSELTRLGPETGIYASDPVPIPDGLSASGAGAMLTVDLARLDARHVAGLPDQFTAWAASADRGAGRADADLELAPGHRGPLPDGPRVRASGASNPAPSAARRAGGSSRRSERIHRPRSARAEPDRRRDGLDR